MKKYEPNQEKIEERLSELLDVLTADERKELMSHMSICEYKKNETIYAEGETPQQLLCLVKGKAKIYKAGIGRIQTLRIVQAVEFFGFRAAFSGQAFITAAAAFEIPAVRRRKTYQGQQPVGMVLHKETGNGARQKR